MDKPFVVPIFAGEKVTAMVVVSLSVETDTEGAHAVEAVKPRLRDGFLKVMFRHANSGGFDGSFTTGRKMEDLKSALLETAREVMAETPVEEVLITEIARQEFLSGLPAPAGEEDHRSALVGAPGELEVSETRGDPSRGDVLGIDHAHRLASRPRPVRPGQRATGRFGGKALAVRPGNQGEAELGPVSE